MNQVWQDETLKKCHQLVKSGTVEVEEEREEEIDETDMMNHLGFFASLVTLPMCDDVL